MFGLVSNSTLKGRKPMSIGSSLNSDNFQVRHQHLGKAGSEKYQDWEGKIARRDAIVELEVQLGLLQRLIERQA